MSFFFSQENQNNLDQNNDKENDPKVQVDGKLAGEINPDNFTYESDFMPKVKTEIKQENSEEIPLLVTNVQSLNEPSKPKEEKLPLDENDANKPQSDGSKTISKSENVPIRHGPNQFGCPYCPKMMQYFANMKLHIRKHTGEKPFKCKTCGKTFSLKQTLEKHRLTHTGEKPFSCNECGKKFQTKQNLARHVLIHTGKQPFKCSYCGKEFNQKCNLDQHKLVHTQEQPFTCAYCGETFNHKLSLKRHSKTHHSK